MLEDLGTLCCIAVCPAVRGAKNFYKLTEPIAVQSKALNLLGDGGGDAASPWHCRTIWRRQ